METVNVPPISEFTSKTSSPRAGVVAIARIRAPMLDESPGVAHKRKDELALMRLEFGLPEQKYLPHDIPLRRNF